MAAKDGRYDTRAIGRGNEHGRAGGRASKQSVGWVAAATPGRPPQLAGRPPAVAGRQPATAGDQSVVCERENGDYILYKEKIRKEEKKAKLTVECINKGLSEKKRREERKGQILTQQKGRAPRQEKR